MGELEHRIALITGSSRGIGAACATVMAREGADVVINYRRSQAHAEETQRQVRALGRNALVIQADVTDPPQVQELVVETVAQFGRIDVLVNNAGHHSTVRYDLETMALDQWHDTLNVNLTSQLLCIRAVLPNMKKQRYGRIVNMSSIVAHVGSRSGDVCYVASKAGVNGLTRALFRQLAPYGITINSVSPGTIDTPMTREVLATPEVIEQYVRRIPLGRMGTAQEVAEVVCFLSSDRAAYVTGQVIHVNGGRYV